jgi:hypothetical protein
MREIVPSAMTPVLTPEDELCLLLARGQLNPEERTRILQFFAIPLQWPLLLERAHSHQVYPRSIATCVISESPASPRRSRPN